MFMPDGLTLDSVKVVIFYKTIRGSTEKVQNQPVSCSSLQKRLKFTF